MTHKLITSQFLRREMAKELWAARSARGMGREFYAGVRFGIESGFWAMQRAIR